jgi:2-C-methyl-D-erythritol 2,4-cyclodiphosphate synthase
MLDFRVGNGFDVHRLVSGRALILCNIPIPCEVGLLGHSDADVALHALADALLGALALGDIGRHFPDNDPQWSGADSGELLKKLLALPEFENWQICNIDLTIAAQKPKLAPYNEAMRHRVAELTAVSVDRVSIKATTTEKLGFVGREEGIAAFCTVSLIRNS